MKQQILVETYSPQESNVVTESIDSPAGKSVYLCGRFLSGEQKNKNGRIYPLSEIAKAVTTMNKLIEEYGRVASELDHPANRLTTELKTVSHVITEVHLDGNNASGKMKIVDTPCGQIVRALLLAGMQPGVSSRGRGVVDENGIVSDYQIYGIDIVSVQSAPGCQPHAVYESLEQYKDSRKILTLAEVVKDDKTAQKYFTKEISKFIESLIK